MGHVSLAWVLGAPLRGEERIHTSTLPRTQPHTPTTRQRPRDGLAPHVVRPLCPALSSHPPSSACTAVRECRGIPPTGTVSKRRPQAQLSPSIPPLPRERLHACAVDIGCHRCGFGLYLTLFSKSFSPFLHSTCMISVSGGYLALEGGHLPPSRCTPKQRYSRTVCVPPGCAPFCTGARYGTITLYGAAF